MGRTNTIPILWMRKLRPKRDYMICPKPQSLAHVLHHQASLARLPLRERHLKEAVWFAREVLGASML